MIRACDAARRQAVRGQAEPVQRAGRQGARGARARAASASSCSAPSGCAGAATRPITTRIAWRGTWALRRRRARQPGQPPYRPARMVHGAGAKRSTRRRQRPPWSTSRPRTPPSPRSNSPTARSASSRRRTRPGRRTSKVRSRSSARRARRHRRLRGQRDATTGSSSTREPDDAEVLERFSVNPPNVYGFGHQAYYEHVVHCLRTNSAALVDGLEGRRSLELITALYESIETGRAGPAAARRAPISRLGARP